MDKCVYVRKRLLEDVLVELSQEDQAMLSRHLQSCDECQEERVELLKLIQTVKDSDQLPKHTSAFWRELTRDTLAHLQHEPESQSLIGRIGEWLTAGFQSQKQWSVALAGLCVMVLAIHLHVKVVRTQDILLHLDELQNLEFLQNFEVYGSI